MQIDERVVDGVTILDLKGKMTLGEGDELLKDKINSLIQQNKKKLLLNLEGVPYIDSAGLGEIVRTYTTVSRQGGKLKLLNLTKRIQDLLGPCRVSRRRKFCRKCISKGPRPMTDMTP